MEEIQEVVLYVSIVHQRYSSSLIAGQFVEKAHLAVWFYTRNSEGNGQRESLFSVLECEPDQLSIVSKIRLLEQYFNPLIGKTLVLFRLDQEKNFSIRLPAGHEEVNSYQNIKKRLASFVVSEVPEEIQPLSKSVVTVLPKPPEPKKESPLLERQTDFRAMELNRDFKCDCGTLVQPTTWNKLGPDGLIVRNSYEKPERCGNFVLDNDLQPNSIDVRCDDCLAKYPSKISYSYGIANMKLGFSHKFKVR